MRLTTKLEKEYQQLFATCKVKPRRQDDVDGLAARVAENKRRYEAVSRPTGIPWHVVGIIHLLESGLRFDAHLHNGDPLTARTVRVPAGRPKTGRPPFTWEQSARDAVRMSGLADWKDWSIAGTLFRFESYNGFGYRNLDRPINSPYLWSFSKHYDRGKFVGDGVFSPTTVSAQCGAAVLMHRLAELELIAPGEENLVEPRTLRLTDPLTTGKDVKIAQRLLKKNEYGDFLPGKVDGEFGELTADASRTAKLLLGFPANRVNRTFGPELEAYLAGEPLPPAYKRERKKRLKELKSEDAIRRKIVKWARWGVKNEPRIEYDQEGPRLGGLKKAGLLPLVTDCSAFVTVIYAWAGAPNPNHDGPFDATRTAFTGSLLAHCRKIPRSAVKPGDLVIWSSAAKSEHVCVVIKPGTDPLLVSHGQDAGPLLTSFSSSNAFHKREGHTKVNWVTAFE